MAKDQNKIDGVLDYIKRAELNPEELGEVAGKVLLMGMSQGIQDVLGGDN